MNRALRLEYVPLGVAILAAPFFLFCLLQLDLGILSVQRFSSVQFVLYTIILYPVCEELIFRGVIQAELLKRNLSNSKVMGISPANGLSSALFAIAHLLYFQNPLALLVFFPSLVFGYFFECFQGLKIPILLHGWYNFFALMSFPLWR
jgi:membrane protease YdiL (CAAX protease family)